jgi:hypothetical protein
VHAVDADYIVINKDFNIALESLLGITKTAVLMSSIQLENNKELMSGLGIY